MRKPPSGRTAARRCVAALALLLPLACDQQGPLPDAGQHLSLVRARRAAPLPLARTEVAGTVWQGRIVVVGGYLANGETTAQVDLWDPGTDSWSRLPDLPDGRNHTAVGVLDGRLYVVGGTSTRLQEDTVWTLGPGERAWREGPRLNHGRTAAAMVSVGDALVIVGGVSDGKLVPMAEELRSGETAWREAGALQHPREHLAAVAAGTGVYAIGGRVGGPGGNVTTVERLGLGTPARDWLPAPSLVTARGGIGAALPGAPCVAGGETPLLTVRSIECLDPEWRVLADLAVPRHGVAVVSRHLHLHVIGGGREPGLFVSDVHEVFEFSAKGYPA